MTEAIDLIYELFKDLSKENREKDKRINELQKQLSAHDVEISAKVDICTFNTLCLKVERMTTRVILISGIFGFIGSAIFVTVIEIIWKLYINKGG